MSIPPPTDPSAAAAPPRKTGSIPPMLPEEADALHFEALRAAGLCNELTEGLLMVLQERVGSKDQDTRRLDLLEHYYDAGGDPVASDRRWVADRMVLFRADNGATARQVARAIAQSHPLLERMVLERLGDATGPLVVRVADDFCAVDDDGVEDDQPTVSVRALVAACNSLLERLGESRRWVPLRGDAAREMYVALDAEAAIPLCLAGHLEEMSTNDLMAIASW